MKNTFCSFALLLFCSSFAFAQPEVADLVAAVVNGEVITFSDLMWAVEYKRLQVPEDAEEKRRFYLDRLNDLINQRLIAHEAMQTPAISVGPEEVEAQIQNYQRQFPSQEAFRARLSEMQMSLEELREIFHRQLAVMGFVQIRFEPFIIVLPDDLLEYYRDVLVPELERARQPVPPIELVEEQIRQILTLDRTNQEIEKWVEAARPKAAAQNDVEILLFRNPPDAPNLPPQLLEQRKEPQF